MHIYDLGDKVCVNGDIDENVFENVIATVIGFERADVNIQTVHGVERYHGDLVLVEYTRDYTKTEWYVPVKCCSSLTQEKLE